MKQFQTFVSLTLGVSLVSGFGPGRTLKISPSSTVSAFAGSLSWGRRQHEYGWNSLCRRDSRACRGRLASTTAPAEAPVTSDDVVDLGYSTINNLKFRALKRECRIRNLDDRGSTATLRARLLQHFEIPDPTAAAATTTVSDAGDSDVDEEDVNFGGTNIAFQDQADADFDFKALQSEIFGKASVGHWKVATRKMKQMRKRFPQQRISEELYEAVLKVCAADRLHGARASEPARKILEDMSDGGYVLPTELANSCVVNCLGLGPHAQHDGHGGIDPALAMIAAMENSAQQGPDMVAVDTYAAVAVALAKEDADGIRDAVQMLRRIVVEKSNTPPLSTFADVATAASKEGNSGEAVLQVMTLAKACGYELDRIGSTEVGRELLASGLIVSQQLNNVVLGLRLLTAASKAEGCAPDRCDRLVCVSSKAAGRAAMLVHRGAIDLCLEQNNWKLALKLIDLMQQRSLQPSPGVFRKVVSLCAKNLKSTKATEALMEWINLYQEGKLSAPPPLDAFNTVIHVCDICDDGATAAFVLKAMEKVHGSSGNVVTYNIALRRAARQGDVEACEQVMAAMSGEENGPNAVSFTTVMAACIASQPKNPSRAYEWLLRMRASGVAPNFHTYNTLLAACLDGTYESTVLAATVATEMLEDQTVDTNPDAYSKTLVKKLLQQLEETGNAANDGFNNVRASLEKLVEFEATEATVEQVVVEEPVAADATKGQVSDEAETTTKKKKRDKDDDSEDVSNAEKLEMDLAYAAVDKMHKEPQRQEV